MDARFWRDRWEQNQIGFHDSSPNPLLLAYFERVAWPSASRILVPLCGKTVDIRWLLSRGHRVAGVELSEIAVQQLFGEMDLIPHRETAGRVTRFSAPGIDIFQGDIFDLSAEILGVVAGVYDRAALIALPENLRRRYAAHLAGISGHAKQLLIGIAYEQRLLPGPPFSVDGAEVRRLYAADFGIEALGSAEVVGGLKGKCPATDQAWLLTPHAAN